jgi:hypothetical protein
MELNKEYNKLEIEEKIGEHKEEDKLKAEYMSRVC